VAGAPRTPAELWSSPEAVALTDRATRAEPYERRLLGEAVQAAGGPHAVQLVHVVGAGTGRELAAVRAAAPTAALRAWDLSEPMVHRCREHLATAGLGDVEVAVRAASGLGPDDGPAQLVVAVGGVVGCIVPGDERRRSIAALASTLAPGGAMALVAQQRRGRPDWALWFAARDVLVAPWRRGEEPGDRRSGYGGTAGLHHHVTRRELRSLLTDAGLEVLQLESLRRYAARDGMRIPRTSPNPLVALARRAG
jgi:SAM-dependent methyltransferase